VRTFEGSWVFSIAITPDGEYIVYCASYDENNRLWEINSGKELLTFEEYDDLVKSKNITTDKKYSVSIIQDIIIELREISSDKILCSYVTFKEDEWLSWTPEGYYNCSGGAYEYFSFIDYSKEIPELVPQNHSVYKAKKKEILLSDYIGGTNPYVKNPPPQADIREYNTIPEIEIDEDEIPF
jgi:WD40 repeat protein